MAVATVTQTLSHRLRTRGIGALCTLLVIVAFAAPARSAPDDVPGGPIAACDGEHLWFFGPSSSGDGTRVMILHHGPGQNEGEAEQASVIEDMPEAALAVDRRLYCIFRGRRETDGRFQNRSVSTVRADTFDASARTWSYEPWPRARTVANLPGEGRISGFVADGRDPLVLLVADQGAEADGNPAPPESDNGAAPSLPRLLRLTIDGWKDVALPEGVGASARLALLGGARPMLLATAAGDDRSQVFTLEDGDQWTAGSASIDVERLIDSATHRGQTFVEVASGADRLAVVMLRPPNAYPVVEVQRSASATRLVQFGASLALAALADPDGVRLTLIDVEAGEMGETKEFRRRMRPAFEEFSLLVLVGAMLFSSLVMFLFRPSDPTRVTVTLPKAARISEPRRRIVALLIDLLPAALLASLILDVPIAKVFDLSGMPMRAHHLYEAWPMLLMFLLCIGHCTISELLWGRTLGKSLVDCWVVGIDGQRPRVISIIVRNAMKFVSLCVPLLFLFVYINQYRQRLGDLAARTIVVTHGEENEAADASIDREP